MTRWLHASETVPIDAGTVEELLHDLRDLLQTATATPLRLPDGDGSFLLEVPARAFGRDLAKQVRVHTGPARRSGRRLVLPVRWHAEPSGILFPTFDGSLEVEELASRRTGIALVGEVTPPFGPLGAIADATVLHSIGDHTATRLLRALCRALEARVRAEGVSTTPALPGYVIPVAEVMTSAPIVVHEDTPLRACAELLVAEGVSGLPVLDDRGTLVGVLSEADLLPRIATDRFGLGRRAAREAARRDARTAGAACSRPARCTATDTSLTDAARQMVDHDVSRLIVLEGGQVEGILTRHDVIRAVLREDAAIADAVAALLQELGAADVVAEVEGGAVHLHGEVERWSLATDLPGHVAALPGVEEVEAAQVTWRVDDRAYLEPSPFV